MDRNKRRKRILLRVVASTPHVAEQIGCVVKKVSKNQVMKFLDFIGCYLAVANLSNVILLTARFY